MDEITQKLSKDFDSLALALSKDFDSLALALSKDFDSLALALSKQEVKIDAIYVSVEKTRKYFKATLIITIVTIVLPLVALVIAIPLFLRTLDLGSLGL